MPRTGSPAPVAETAAAALSERAWPRFLRGADGSLLKELYTPALSCAVAYDRCCAYFTSRVLATAARGFGGLVQNLLDNEARLARPAVRLIVNEQLDPADVEALLARGDETALIDLLLKRFRTPQDALEQNRLRMLAWLVASGWLEVRVGVMRHHRGIVHAKFGLIRDREGNTLAFNGSDNETGEALTQNYEELILGGSWDDGAFVENYRNRFETLWDDRDEAVATVTLPEAVRLKLIELAPAEAPPEMPDDRPLQEAAMVWRFLAAAPCLPNGAAACDATALVDLWPHQQRVVEDTSAAFPAGRLLCDEVGMGKTIEALLVLRRLLAGRGVRRALLLVPAGLLNQWQEELREKGGLLIPIWDRGELIRPGGNRRKQEARAALEAEPILLISREWARRETNRDLLLAALPWDLVLLDEAHAARRRESEEGEFNTGNLLMDLLRELQLRGRARGILLLSATPMQTHPWEPWDLLSTLGVGGHWMAEFADVSRFYQGVAEIRRHGLDPTLAAHVARMVERDPGFPQPPEQSVPSSPGTLADRLCFSPSTEWPVLAEWLRRGAPLGRRMHRNTRDTLRDYHAKGLLESPPAQREPRDECFDYADRAERELYESITAYIEERFEQLERERAGKGFVMTVYRRRASSSPQALRASLQRRLEGLDRVIRRQHLPAWLDGELGEAGVRDIQEEEREEQIDLALPPTAEGALAEKARVEPLLAALEALGPVDSKYARFREILHEITADGRAALVFTEYTDTLLYLRDLLRPHYGDSLACYSGRGGEVWVKGRWQHVGKAEIVERLSSRKLSVILCTDAASEGLNLQAAGALINYDLPWNPSRVEQRIGRIDRIGQAHSLLPIRNLFLRDSVDMRVYQVLHERCGLFERFVGEMQPVLELAQKTLSRIQRSLDLPRTLADLEKEIGASRERPAVSAAFAAAAAEPLPPAPPPAVRRRDLEWAMDELCSLTHPRLTVSRDDRARRWKLKGFHRVQGRVTTDRTQMERDRSVAALTLGAPVVDGIARELSAGCGPSPLVLAEAGQGPFRAAEARWVRPDGAVPVETVEQLRGLLAEWDGAPPSLPALRVAESGARATAASRVAEAVRRAGDVARKGLEDQVSAARLRLLRELGRTLRCSGPGDLGARFKERLQSEDRPTGRYHRCRDLLGGMPQWTPEETASIESYFAGLNSQQRNTRLLGSQLDAALNDPRWKAIQK